MPADALDGRHETEKERLDRNLNELLGELRVALPGVQVLFAFLLAVPFNQRFSSANQVERDIYLVTMILTTAALALLIAPSAYHRILFRQDDKAHIIDVSNRSAIIGLAFLAGAMTGVVLLVSAFIFGTVVAIVVSIAALIAFVTLWYTLPLRRRRAIARDPSRADPQKLRA